ncbi:MAG: hypothetical protein J0I45_16450 [Bosea sp.]|nr:hypothetical protein [Bosea sp. (in: a-proteobacteria)]
MSALTYNDRARDWGRVLEDRERARSGLPLNQARERVAAKVGASPGTLENLRKGRLKKIAAHVYDRMRWLVIAELQAEVAAHEHEIQTLMAIGADPHSDAMEEAQTSLRQIKAVLTREARHA